MDDFRKMSMRQLLDAGIGKDVDCHEGAMGDTHIPWIRRCQSVTVGFRKNLPAQSPEDEARK
jgi:hypothetical protein